MAWQFAGLCFTALLLLAGCTAPAATPSASQAASPSPTPAPFHVDREGDLLPNGTSGEWHWRVEPGFTAFRVHLFLTEMPGGPALTATHDVGFHLVGEGADGHRVSEGEDGGALSAGNGDGCALCEDSGFPGAWTFTLAAGPSAAHYRLHIETTY